MEREGADHEPLTDFPAWLRRDSLITVGQGRRDVELVLFHWRKLDPEFCQFDAKCRVQHYIFICSPKLVGFARILAEQMDGNHDERAFRPLVGIGIGPMQHPGSQVQDPDPLVHELLSRPTVERSQCIPQVAAGGLRGDQLIPTHRTIPVLKGARLLAFLRLGRLVEAPPPSTNKAIRHLDKLVRPAWDL